MISAATRALAALAIATSTAIPAMAQYKPPTEAQCRGLVDVMLKTMRSTPLNTEKEKRDGRALLERVEKLVTANRAGGKSECESWTAINNIVSKQ